MIWKIIQREFLLNLVTFKFGVGLAVCVVLMSVLVPVLVSDYAERLEDYHDNTAENDAQFRRVKVYKNITPTVYRPPKLLSVFAKGIDEQLDRDERIDTDVASGTGTAIQAANALLSVFPVMDVTLIFKVVVSVLALLMAYDVISGEREQGILKLMLANPCARYQVLLAKFADGWMSLAGLVDPIVSVGFTNPHILGMGIDPFHFSLPHSSYAFTIEPVVDLTGCTSAADVFHAHVEVEVQPTLSQVLDHANQSMDNSLEDFLIRYDPVFQEVLRLLETLGA